MQEAGSSRYDLAQFWLHPGHNGHNQNASRLDPACLLSTMKPMHQENHASAYQHMVQVEKELLDQIHMIITMNTKSA